MKRKMMIRIRKISSMNMMKDRIDIVVTDVARLLLSIDIIKR